MERGYTLSGFQDFTQALEHHEAALAAAVKSRGRDHPEVAEEASRLGHILEALGELERARVCFEQAQSIVEGNAAEDDPDRWMACLNLGGAIRQLGNRAFATGDELASREFYIEARAWFERGLERQLAVLGEGHPEAAETFNLLGGLCQALLELEAAAGFYGRALAVLEAAHGPAHARVAALANTLGVVLEKLGRPAEARPLLERALAYEEKAHGPRHPAVLSRLANLARTLEAAGDLKAAAAIWERSKDAYTRNHSAEHPQVGACLAALARLQAASGNVEGARVRYEKALAILQARLGPEHPLTREAREGFEKL